MRLQLRAGFDTYTGFGSDGVDIARFMARAGVDVVPMPMNMLPGLPAEFTKLLEKDPTGSYDVVMTFAPPFDIKPYDFAAFGRRAVGYSMWERSLVTLADMKGHGWKQRRKHWWSDQRHRNGRRQDLDLMMVTCLMNVDAFKNLDDRVPYAVVPCGIDPKGWPVLDRDRTRPIKFGMIGMLNGRKDPFLLLQAWKELKDEHPEFDATLDMKTMCPGLHPAIEQWLPGVKIYERAWTREQVLEWYGTVDVLVSTSRGEGNNKPAMEFMATGGPVIATAWSGNTNWLHPSAGYPLRGQLMQSTPASDALDFRGDKAHLKELLLHCWKERTEVAEKGKVAASMIRSNLSWEVVVAKMLRAIAELG